MDLSIIIPCYNAGQYLPDALSSVGLATKGENYTFEVIIVDDGSTDSFTKTLLETLADEGYTILYRENGGPAAARNTGVKKATGKFLIFLDSDNKLKANYIEKTMEVQRHTGAHIVHCKSDFFGDTTEARFVTGHFDINKIIVENYIDICCLISREAFNQIGGFDEDKRVIGFEDWEFFVRAYALDYVFQYVEEPVYDYRILAGSQSQQHTYEYIQAAKHYVYKKHINVLTQVFEWYNGQYNFHLSEQKRPFYTFLKYTFRRIKAIYRKFRRLIG